MKTTRKCKGDLNIFSPYASAKPAKRDWRARLNEVTKLVTEMNLDLIHEFELLDRRAKKPVNGYEFSRHHQAVSSLFQATNAAEKILRDQANDTILFGLIYPPEKIKEKK